MASSAAAPARIIHKQRTGTMNKHEVIEFLGKSKRTVEKYIADGRLAVSYFNGPNGRTAAFERQAVEAFKREMDVPMVRAITAPLAIRPEPSRSVSIRPDPALGKAGEVGQHLAQASAIEHFLAEIIRGFSVNRPRPWLTLSEAVDYSGLPATYLLTQARSGARLPDGRPRAVNVGSGAREFWRFSRRALA